MDAIKRSFWSARKALSKDFTPNYIGFEQMEQQTCDHVSCKTNMKNGMDLRLLEMAKKCFSENLKMVLK
jgi:hypothetical protein